MNLWGDLVLEIEKVKKGYVYLPIPCELDEKISSLIKLFIQASPSERLMLHEQPLASSGCFNAFAIRSAALAVREHSFQRALEGLIALVIEDCRAGDYRDTLTALAPLYDAAGKIGLDADSLLKSAAAYMDNHASNLLKGFADRPVYTKKLQNFGFKEIDAPDGFRYEFVP